MWGKQFKMIGLNLLFSIIRQTKSQTIGTGRGEIFPGTISHILYQVNISTVFKVKGNLLKYSNFSFLAS